MLSTIFEVDEITAELVALTKNNNNLENALINNNLLTSCTIAGVTDDWYKLHETITVEGKSCFCQRLDQLSRF